MAKIDEKVLDILGECRAEGNTLFLPNIQLDRKTYTAVNKVLEMMGGKWNRKAKGHVFQTDDPAEVLETVLLTQEVTDRKKEFQFFPTPRAIAERMCELAELDDLDGDAVALEPSCGDGRLADVVLEHFAGKMLCVELNQEMERCLKDKPYHVSYCDFLDIQKADVGHIDRIVMNPPFTRHQDIEHILHAFDLLDSGGILVSVACESPFFRTDKKSVLFREFLEENGAEIYWQAAGAFHESETEIVTRLVKIRKRQ